MQYTKEAILSILLRLAMGFTLLWPFFDKLFGLGFSTTPDKSWLAGVSPTAGFLKNVKGPFAGIFQGMAGNPLVDWLFMLGLLFIGLALILGIGMKIAGYSGALLMLLMWTASLFPKSNPVLDDHIIYLLILLSFTSAKAGSWYGLGKWWSKTSLVKNHRWLE